MAQKWRKLMKSVTLFSITLLVALLLCGADGVLAAWPEKQVDLVNPLGAGGAADVQARRLAEIISKDTGTASCCAKRHGRRRGDCLQ